MKILERSFYQQDTVAVAQDLIGKILIRSYNGQLLTGRIVETEAYGGSDDPASHAYRKKTERNKAMFEEVGRAYIYFIYGVHFALNLVARTQDSLAGAVLVRAVEPLQGLEYMRELRSKYKIHSLTSGPGKLAQAYGITKDLYGCDVTQEGALYIADDQHRVTLQATSRIGIRVGVEKMWRFIDPLSAFISSRVIR